MNSTTSFLTAKGQALKSLTLAWIESAEAILKALPENDKKDEMTFETLQSVVDLIKSQLNEYDPESMACRSSLVATLYACHRLWQDAALALPHPHVPDPVNSLLEELGHINQRADATAENMRPHPTTMRSEMGAISSEADD